MKPTSGQFDGTRQLNFPSAPHSGVDALVLNSKNEDGSVRTSSSARYGDSNPTAQREIKTSD